MNNLLQNKKSERISPSHRNLLAIVWKIHQGIRNGTEDVVLRKYLKFVWDLELRDHFLDEEIIVSSHIKEDSPVTDIFFHYHSMFRKKLKQIHNPANPFFKENLENLCILLIEMVRHEERIVKPYLRKFVSENILQNVDIRGRGGRNEFFPVFWDN